MTFGLGQVQAQVGVLGPNAGDVPVLEEPDAAGSDEGIDHEANQPGEIPSDPAIAIHSALGSTAAGSDLHSDALSHQSSGCTHQQQILAG